MLNIFSNVIDQTYFRVYSGIKMEKTFGLVSSRGSSKKFAGKILLGNNMNNL